MSRDEAAALLAQPSRKYPTGVRDRALIRLFYRGGLRCAEALALRPRPRDVRSQPDRHAEVGSGERTIALDEFLAAELFDHRGRTRFAGDDERVFCHPLTGGPLDHKHYAATLKDALAKGKVEGPMRPFHDGRHSSITNGAATGINPHALMARAGHSDFKTTSLYIDLAGETFREEAAKVGERIFASVGQKSGHS